MKLIKEIAHSNASVQSIKSSLAKYFKKRHTIVVLSRADILLLLASILIARSDGFTDIVGAAPALWLAYSATNRKYRGVLLLAMTVGFGSVAETRTVLSFWLFVLTLEPLRYLLRDKFNSWGYKYIVPFFAIGTAYVLRLDNLSNITSLMIYVLTSLLLSTIFSVAIDNKIFKNVSIKQVDLVLLCRLILMAITLSGIGEMYIGSLSVFNILKHIMLMVIASSGAYPAALAGLIIGSGLLRGAVSPQQAGQACLTGFISGIGITYSRIIMLLSYISINILWLWQASADSIYQLVEIIIAVAIYMLVSTKISLQDNTFYNPGVKLAKNKDSQSHNGKEWLEIADVFEEIAVVLNDAEYQPQTHFHQIIEWTGQSLCYQCAQYYQCWHENLFLSYHRWKEILEALETEPVKAEMLFTDLLPEYCPNIADLSESLRTHLHLIRLELFWRNRLHECNSIAIERLYDIADMARVISLGHPKKKGLESELSDSINDALQQGGIMVQRTTVTCDDSKRIVDIDMMSCYDLKSCPAIIIPTVTNIVGGKLISSNYDCAKYTKKLSCNCYLQIAPSINISYGVAGRPASNVSGDSFWSANLPDGRHITLLSDGMGSGEIAKRESEYAIELLRKLLQTGLSLNSVIKLLNTALALGIKQDAFVTIDGIIIDSYSSDARLIKIGSSYTCLLRGDDVKVWCSSTLPVGVFPEVDIDEYEMQIRPGDVIVMLTDGFIDNQRDIVDVEKYLVSTIRNAPKRSANALAEYILDIAEKHSDKNLKDDMTVIVLLIT